MNATVKMAEIITNEALKTMADKAKCTTEEIVLCIISDPKGNTARYLSDLIEAAINKFQGKFVSED